MLAYRAQPVFALPPWCQWIQASRAPSRQPVPRLPAPECLALKAHVLQHRQRQVAQPIQLVLV